MSDQSEFEIWKEAVIKTWDTELLTKSDCIKLGMNAARHWIINEAHRLAYTDGYLRPSELEEACK